MRIESNYWTGIRAGSGTGRVADVPNEETRQSEETLEAPQSPEPAAESSPATIAAGDPMAKVLAQLPSSAAARSTEVDPRFDAINDAIQAGNGEQAMQAARELLAVLQKEKLPQARLLNQARMSLAAGAMLAGDLDSAQKSLLAVDAKALKDGESEQYAQLVDLLKGARQEAYSDAFPTEEANEGGAKDKGKAAAEQAGKLLDLLQKTDPDNGAEISEARLKQAHALLMGNNYRGAEKALKGIDEKSLDDAQKEYLGVLREGIQAQFIDALSKAYDYDMKRKNFKDAATNATVIVNNLAKHFPESKDHLVIARMQQGAAQIMNGDMDDARKSLARVDRDQLKQMDEAVGKRYKALSGAVHQHFENVKEEQALKAEAAAIEGQLKVIEDLTSTGNKTDAARAVPLAEQLLTTIKEKYPDNESAIAGARLTLANAKLAAGDMAGGKADLQAIADTAKDPATRHRAQLLQAHAALKENQTDKAVRMLRELSTGAATPELRQAAKGVIISLELSQLKNVERKLKFEQKRLDAIKEDKTPQSAWAFLNPITSLEQIGGHYDRMLEEHVTNLNWLQGAEAGAAFTAIVMKKDNLTLAELQNMKVTDIARLPRIGMESANLIDRALHIGDVKQMARGQFQDNFSWHNNTPYVDASYLDHTYERSAKFLGDVVRDLRSKDEDLKESDHWYHRAAGYTSGAILDAISASNQFVKEKIKDASEFYNDPTRKDTWYAALGRAGTFGADMLTTPFTAPATIVDYKTTDAERSQAMLGTVLMLGGVRLAKNLGPAMKSFTNPVFRGASRIAATRAGQWVANSEVGQLVGSGAQKIGNAAQKIGSKVAQVEGRFEATGFAKGMDRLKEKLGNINRFGRPKTSGRAGAEGGAAASAGDDAAKGAKGQGADPNAADTVKMRKAAGGEAAKSEGNAAMDAADTLDMPKVGDGGNPVTAPGRNMGSLVDEVVGDNTAAQLRAGVTQQEVKNLEGKLIKDEYKKLVAEKRNELTLAGKESSDKAAKALIQTEYPGEALREKLRASMRSKFSEEDVRRIILGKHIYKRNYHGEIDPKPASITQEKYEADLALSKGRKIDENANFWESPNGKARIMEDDYWHHRTSNVDGDIGLDPRMIRSGVDIRRFYFNVKPDKAAELADHLAARLSSERVKWQFKMPKELESFDRPDSGVLYVAKKDYQAVKKIVMEYAEKHPEAFADGVPALTKQIHTGIGVAEEPLQKGLPKTRGARHSFGSSRSDIIADAILRVPADATNKEIMAMVRQSMKKYGLDPDRPWLSRSTGVDDL